MPPSRSQVLDALRRVRYPGFSRDLVALGVVQDVQVEGGAVRLRLVVTTGDAGVADRIEREAREAVAAVAGVERVRVERAGTAAGAAALPVVGAPAQRPTAAAGGALDASLIPRVRRTVAVASGKGGVGKSTVAVHLAAALGAADLRVGLLDADIYGPSIPLMVGLRNEKPALDASSRLVPFERHGFRLMSLGFLVDPESAVIWRGPLVMKAVEQLLRDVDWGELDVLVVDMPPGTGDVQLTLAQKVQLAGAVVVTTPQDVALADAIKGVAMFRKVGVPVLGIVENMSYFVCPHCEKRSEIFGHGGGREQAARLGVPFLGEIPLDAAIRSCGDTGEPVIAVAPDSASARAFREIAESVRATLLAQHGAAEDDAASRGSVFDRFREIWRGPQERG